MVSLIITKFSITDYECVFHDLFNRTRSRVRKNNAYLHRSAEDGKQLDTELVHLISHVSI